MIPFASKVTSFTILNKCSSFFRSHEDPSKVAYPLKNRSLVKVSGPEATQFLQGLITNDMKHFEEGAKSMYAMFLNNKGRVLYDTLVHKWGTETESAFMLECDTGIKHLLQRHLKIYKLKRKINVEDVTELFKVWALIAPPDVEKDLCSIDIKHEISVYKDPRLADLGHRLITRPDMGQVDIHQAIGNNTVVKSDQADYRALRYRLGVSEGADDMYPGTCFPLEVNCDYLHGVSFHKGCYIGQELTARVHHTGVVRKRIMPIHLLDIKVEDDLQKDATIWGHSENGKKINLGKFKNYYGSYGLGLVRIKEAVEAASISIGLNPIEIIKPHWWPVEAPKEKLTIKADNVTTTS